MNSIFFEISLTTVVIYRDQILGRGKKLFLMEMVLFDRINGNSRKAEA